MIRFEVTQERISAEVKKEPPVNMSVQDTVLVKIQGKSAYEVAVENGFEGTEEEWLESLKGEPGPAGIQGEQGPAGADGADGSTPVKGTDYYTEADKAEMVQAVISALPVYDGSVTSA